MKTATPTMNLAEWVMLIALSVVWGGAFFGVEIMLDAMPPMTIVAARAGLAAVVLGAVVIFSRLALPWDGRSWVAFLIMGFSNNALPFSLIVWGQTEITGGLAAILIATTPLFTVLMAQFFAAEERLTSARMVGVSLGLMGVAVMIGPAAMAGLGGNALAQLAVLAAALSYACAGIFGRRFRDLPPLVPAAGQLATTTMMLVPLALIIDRPWTLPMPGLEVWAAMIGVAIFSTAIAYILYFRILSTAGATNVLLVTFLAPISAILLGSLIIAERLEPRNVAGMLLIFAGLAAIDGRPARWLRARLAL
ncbi:MAG: DMT family transporter [Pseudomonadota bacterium]